MSVCRSAVLCGAFLAGVTLLHAEGVCSDRKPVSEHAVEEELEPCLGGVANTRAEPVARQGALQTGQQAVVSEGGNGVVTLESGLRYRILDAGTGDIPSLDDHVVVQYRGTLCDGTEFDSTYRRGSPATFPLRNVIPGWREALQRMPVGSRWQLVVPPQLAYGKRGAGGVIGPNATLAFEVALLEIAENPVITPQLRDIRVSFKLDPRLTRGLYMGDRWVAAPAYSGTRREGDTYLIEARVQGITTGGVPIGVKPVWIPADPQMVTVVPAGEGTVQIVVMQAGESRLRLETPGFSKELLIKATREDTAMQVQITQ